MSTPRPNVTSPAVLRELLARYGVRPSRRLGQSFLVDANLVRRIVAAAQVGAGDRVFEVGPGAGALTVALADAATQVVALELDARLVGLLSDLLGDAQQVRIIQGDILKADLGSLLGGAGWKLLANLPYAIVGPAIARLLEQRDRFAVMLLMVQREVAQRLMAAPGGRDYGVLSVLVQAWARAESVLQAPRTCFYPQPRVDSTVVRITPAPQPVVPPDLESAFTAVVRGVFRQRRKMVLNALAGATELEVTRPRAARALAAAGIAGERRPETLSPADFAALARALRS